MAGGVTEKKALDIQSTIENKKMFSVSIDNYWIETKNELENINSDWKDKTLQSFKIVLDKISMIPANKLDRHLEIVNELNEKKVLDDTITEQIVEAVKEYKSR
mgnify:CR=1 FL=1